MAKLYKKGHCPHCGVKYQEGWGTLCECEGSLEPGGGGTYRKCAGGCGSTLPPGYRPAFCEDCRAAGKEGRRISGFSGPGVSGWGPSPGPGGEGVGGATGGPHDEFATVPAPGTFLKDAKGQVYVITNVTVVGVHADGPEVEVKAKLVPRGAFEPPFEIAKVKSDLLSEHSKDIDWGKYDMEAAKAAAVKMGLMPYEGPKVTHHEVSDPEIAAKTSWDDHATRERVYRVTRTDGSVMEWRESDYGRVSGGKGFITAPEHDAAWAAGPWVAEPLGAFSPEYKADLIRRMKIEEEKVKELEALAAATPLAAPPKKSIRQMIDDTLRWSGL